jgi:hypothetical protein
LTDVRQVLDKTVAAMQSYDSVHFELSSKGQFLFGFETPSPSPADTSSAAATLTASPSATAASSGTALSSASAVASLTPSPLPSPSPSPAVAAISLDGGTATGDIDLVNVTAHIVGTLPSLPDLAGEAVIVGGFAYVRSPGQNVFTQVAESTLTYDPTNKTSGPVALVSAILAIAADKTLSPKLIGTEAEPYGPCYHIQVQAKPDVVQSQLSLTGVGAGYAILDLWVYQSDFRVERMDIHASDPASGSAAMRLVLSNYNRVAPIEVPPPAQLATPVAVPSAS